MQQPQKQMELQHLAHMRQEDSGPQPALVHQQQWVQQRAVSDQIRQYQEEVCQTQTTYK